MITGLGFPRRRVFDTPSSATVAMARAARRKRNSYSKGIAVIRFTLQRADSLGARHREILARVDELVVLGRILLVV